jgi:hypothetical protein
MSLTMIIHHGRNNLQAMDGKEIHMSGDFGNSESEAYRRLEKFRRAALERNKAIRARQVERWSRVPVEVSLGSPGKQRELVRYASICICMCVRTRNSDTGPSKRTRKIC